MVANYINIVQEFSTTTYGVMLSDVGSVTNYRNGPQLTAIEADCGARNRAAANE